jgi:NTE family protein
MHRRTIIPLFFLLLFWFSGLPTFSQETATLAERPKLGLVLSGGGAKGIAHIGILKALEEEGLRPDYISGTSMGSIIGGLYSLGYSADQLDTIIRSVNWDMVLSNNIPLQYIAYEEKEYYNRFLVEFPFANGGLKLPSGLIEGQMLGELLSRYTWPSKNYDAFDDFPIPFRCVATDVSTGKPIVFREGSLAKAIRASMAIPSAFSAVDLDTTLAVDGGVVNNFPVEELFDMGADFVIGVNVSHGFLPAYKIGNMTGILLQIAMIPSSEKLPEQIRMCDIYIMPPLDDYSTASFGSYAEILNIGYETGEKFRPVFKALADSIGQDPNPLPAISLEVDSVIVGSIQIKGLERTAEPLVRSKLAIVPGQKVSRSDIEIGIKQIYGVRNFSKVDYRLSPLPESGQYLLTVQVRENDPVMLKGSIHYDNIFKFGVVGNLTLRNVLGKSSRTIVAADISENPKFRFDYLKYIGQNQHFALNARYDFRNEQLPFYEEGLLTDVEVSRHHEAFLSLMATQSLKRSFLVGATYNYLRQKQKFANILPEGVDYGNFHFFQVDFWYLVNTLNNRNYPTRGREMSFIAKLYFESDYSIRFEKGVDTVYIPIEIENGTFDFPITESQFNDLIVEPLIPDVYGTLQMSYSHFIPLRNNFQFIPAFNAGLTLATDSAGLFNNFRIGGYQRVRSSDVPYLGLTYAEVSYPY